MFLCVALFSCFIGFSFSSSADVVNDVTPINITSVFLVDINNSSYHYLSRSGNTFSFTEDLGVSTPTPCFLSLQFYFSGLNYKLPSYSGRPISLSFNIDFDVIGSRYLDLAPSGPDILYSCIFNNAYIYVNFTDGTSTQIFYDTFLLRDDDTGEVLNWNSADYWNMAKGGNFDFDISILFDVTPYLGKTFNYVTIVFPGNNGRIYYSNDDLTDYLVLDDINANLDFAYTPFNDVVQDDLSDIKSELGTLNSTMNTIDQDVNRVNQKLDQTNDILGDVNQGIQDILKPSTPAVDFKNQWNDYFTNNPIPDLSGLPSYDITNMMTLLADSSQIIRSMFAPFFLRDYSVTVPLTQGFANVKLNPVATYVSLSFGLSLAVVIIGLLKGSRR